MWIIIYGNPIDGFGYIGPFDSHEEAVRYMDDEPSGHHDNMWTALLDLPED